MRLARAYLARSRRAEQVRPTADATVEGAMVRALWAVAPAAPHPISERMTGDQARSRNSRSTACGCTIRARYGLLVVDIDHVCAQRLRRNLLTRAVLGKTIKTNGP